jgi:hypothetical protein
LRQSRAPICGNPPNVLASFRSQVSSSVKALPEWPLLYPFRKQAFHKCVPRSSSINDFYFPYAHVSRRRGHLSQYFLGPTGYSGDLMLSPSD